VRVRIWGGWDVKRLLAGKEAAAYCGCGVTLFRAHCTVIPKRIAPGPRGLRYDLRDLDRWIDELGFGDRPRTADDWLGVLDAEHSKDRAPENSRRKGLPRQGDVVRLSPKNRTAV
jgi:hypothetical protein